MTKNEAVDIFDKMLDQMPEKLSRLNPAFVVSKEVFEAYGENTYKGLDVKCFKLSSPVDYAVIVGGEDAKLLSQEDYENRWFWEQ